MKHCKRLTISIISTVLGLACIHSSYAIDNTPLQNAPVQICPSLQWLLYQISDQRTVTYVTPSGTIGFTVVAPPSFNKSNMPISFERADLVTGSTNQPGYYDTLQCVYDDANGQPIVGLESTNTDGSFIPGTASNFKQLTRTTTQCFAKYAKNCRAYYLPIIQPQQ